MLLRNAARITVLVMGLLLALVVAPSASAATVRTLYYDTSQAQEFAADWDKAAANWNASVTSVKLVKRTASSPVNIRIYADNDWPRAYTSSLGNGTVYMGRQAVNQGYYRPRISTHEIGHILGLPDNRTGRCADLMAGSSAPTSCTSQLPSAAEAAKVQSNFATSTAASDAQFRGTFSEAPALAGR